MVWRVDGVKVYKFRRPHRCQNGHFNYLYFELHGDKLVNHKWGESKCSCPKWNIGEGYSPIGGSEMCTGIIDKNKVEIYNGDILSNGTGRIGKVVWFEPQACFDVEPLTSKGTSKAFEPNNWCHCEVIGNVHEGVKNDE
jgi:hypothetical protein